MSVAIFITHVRILRNGLYANVLFSHCVLSNFEESVFHIV